MKSTHSWPLLLAGTLALVALSMFGCDQTSNVAGGGSDDTHTSVVDIQGRVLTKDAMPYGNVIVRLRSLKLTDTTKSDGKFRFLADSAPRIANASAVDTVDYLRDGQVIVSVPVPTWTSTLPDIMLVQRDISGSIIGDPTRVAATRCQIRLPDGRKQSIDLEWNATLRNYSGFVYFRYTGGVDSFATMIQSLDDSGRELGRSDSVYFTSRAGNILVPSFLAENSLPTVALRNEFYSPVYILVDGKLTKARQDTIDAGRRESVRIYAEVDSNLNRWSHLEWNLDGAHWIRSSQNPTVDPRKPRSSLYDTTISVPSDAVPGTVWHVRARAVTFDGIWSEDTFDIHIVGKPPSAKVSFPTMPAQMSKPFQGNYGVPSWSRWEVAQSSQVRIHLQDSARFGERILKHRLRLLRYAYKDQRDCVDSIPWPYFQPQYNTEKSLPKICQDRIPLESIELGPVSGADTTITFPRTSGEFAVQYEVVDSDSDVVATLSPFVVVRSATSHVDSIVPFSDSVAIHWSATTPKVSTLQEFGTIHWHTTVKWFRPDHVVDSVSVESSDSSRSLVMERPLDASGCEVIMERTVSDVKGFMSDTIIDNVPAPPQTFAGSIADPRKLWGKPEWTGGARSILTGSVGSDLNGEVARIDWFMEDSTGSDTAGAMFDLVAPIGAKALHIDLANRSSLACRIRTIDRDDPTAFYSWDIPAGTVGPLRLELDSSFSTAYVVGISVFFAPTGAPDKRKGELEIDNLRWE